MDAHGVVVGRAQSAPQVGIFGRGVGNDLDFEGAPATRLDQSKNGDEQCAGPDQNELEHLVEDGGAQSTQGNIDGDRAGRDPDADVDVPTQNNFQDQRHRIHVDAAHQHSHKRKLTEESVRLDSPKRSFR